MKKEKRKLTVIHSSYLFKQLMSLLPNEKILQNIHLIKWTALPLSYTPFVSQNYITYIISGNWSAWEDSNPRPLDGYQCATRLRYTPNVKIFIIFLQIMSRNFSCFLFIIHYFKWKNIIFTSNMTKKLTKYKIISVWCKCWQKLVKYKKGPWRRLLKIHRDRITKDYAWVFLENCAPAWSDILCPNCLERITTVQNMNWKFINKVNQWQIGIIKKS